MSNLQGLVTTFEAIAAKHGLAKMAVSSPPVLPRKHGAHPIQWQPGNDDLTVVGIETAGGVPYGN